MRSKRITVQPALFGGWASIRVDIRDQLVQSLQDLIECNAISMGHTFFFSDTNLACVVFPTTKNLDLLGFG